MKHWFIRQWCQTIGHRWDGDIDPVCLRCGYALAESVSIPGSIYMGWGRHGTITEPRKTPSTESR